jgi:hypothetical protein
MVENNLIRSKNKNYSYLFFLLWPFASFIYSLKNYRQKSSRNIVALFIGFMGFTIVISGTGFDAYRYAEWFKSFSIGSSGVGGLFHDLYSDQSKMDIYDSLLMGVVSFFTDNWRIFYATVGLIYGFFYSRNIWYLLDRINWKLRFTTAIFIIGFGFIYGTHSYQFVRFSTAALIFFFGAFPYFFEGKRNKLLWVLITPLVHWSFFYPVTLMFAFILLPKKLDVYFSLFVVTTFFIEFELTPVTEFLKNILPSGGFQEKIGTYGNEGYAETIQDSFETLNWYIRYRGLMIKYLIIAFTIYLFITERKRLYFNKNYNVLFAFSLLLYSVGNVLSVIPSGGRFIALAQLFLFGLFILSLDKIKTTKFLKIILFTSYFILIIYVIVGVRIALDTMGVGTIFGNPFTALFLDDTTPIIDYVKSLIN